MAKSFEFPKWLQRSPEEVAQESQIQEQRRAGFSRAHLTEEERLISRGALLEETARGNLDAAQKTKGKEARRQEREERKKLAGAMALQGRYEEAVKIHPFKRMQKHYQQIIDAIELPDTEKCNCEDSQGQVDGQTVSVTPRFVSEEIFSQKHQGVVSVIVCAKCGHQNARIPSRRIPISRAAMSQNRATAEGKGGRGLIRDAELLKVK